MRGWWAIPDDVFNLVLVVGFLTRVFAGHALVVSLLEAGREGEVGSGNGCSNTPGRVFFARPGGSWFIYKSVVELKGA